MLFLFAGEEQEGEALREREREKENMNWQKWNVNPGFSSSPILSTADSVPKGDEMGSWGQKYYHI